jgi:hypothetical protein
MRSAMQRVVEAAPADTLVAAIRIVLLKKVAAN